MPAAQRRLAGEPKARPGLLLLAGEPKARPGFSYLAAYMLGLVLGLVCQSAISFLVVLSGYFGAATPAGG